MHIIGAGGHAKVVLDILQESDLAISGVWDENPDLKSFMGYDIRGNFSDFLKLASDEVIFAIGNNKVRKRLTSSLDRCVSRAIHPKSVISKYATIGCGTMIMANVTVNAEACVGQHVIINTNASIDHECVISDFVHISPNAALGGNVKVGEGTHVGLGASIIHGISIGKWAIIGAGAVVIKDIPDYAVVVGNPGRIIKYNKP